MTDPVPFSVNPKKLTQKLDEVTKAFHKLYSNPKILLIDDNESDYIALRTMFDRFNVHLVYGRSVEDGILILRENNFSLILLDWKMPGQTGAAMIDYLNAKRIPIPVAIFSGYLDSVSVNEAAEKRVVALLPKPLTLEHAQHLLQLFKLS